MRYKTPGHWEWQWCSVWASRSSHSRAAVGCGEKLTRAYHLLLALSAPPHPCWCHQSSCREVVEVWVIKKKVCMCQLCWLGLSCLSLFQLFAFFLSCAPAARSKCDQACTVASERSWSGSFVTHSFLLACKPAPSWNLHLISHAQTKGYDFLQCIPEFMFFHRKEEILQ